jgi:hypothetical protein
MAETRKLAAILAADVAGYSKLAGADEERTLAHPFMRPLACKSVSVRERSLSHFDHSGAPGCPGRKRDAFAERGRGSGARRAARSSGRWH